MGNRLPQVGDTFYDDNLNRFLRIIEVGDKIEDEGQEGRSVTVAMPYEDEVGMDCFWSQEHQRFQYHTDAYNARYDR